MAAVVERPIEHKKARAEEASKFIGQLDEVTQKALYIATQMFLSAKETEEEKAEIEKEKTENE